MMKRNEIISALKKYFAVKELVCQHTFAKWGENSWRFLDDKYLETLLVIRRDILKKPMVCNNSIWKQRGLRCNMCNLVKEKKSVYLSAHIFGKAGDFAITGMTADNARKAIIDNAHLLPYPIRMEDGVSWLHVDVMNDTDEKIICFKS